MNRICLNMIVKDESQVIRRCLASVKKLIDYWVIVDTGSSDGTQSIIREMLWDIPGELHERPWVHFEWNRNEALDLARDKAEYTLFIDADDELIFLPDYSLPHLIKDSYLALRQLKTDELQIDSQWVLLIRNQLPWKWKGVLHEEIRCSEAKSCELLSGVVNLFHRDGNRSSDPEKYAKDIEILKRAIQSEPDNSRYLFYLAEALKAANDFPSAIQVYEKTARMKGADPEEIYWSLYWIGRLQNHLQIPSETFLASYYKCYLNRPDRAEPLCDWANFYINQENYLMGYLLSEWALSIPFPNAPSCKRWIYEWAILLQFFTCADHLGKKKEAKKALWSLLQNPNLPAQLRRELEKEKLRFG